MKTCALLLLSTAFAATPARAQQQDLTAAQPAQEQPDRDQQVQTEDHVHDGAGQDIVITAPFLRELDILAGRAVLSGTDLVREMRPQLGETLARLPGVSATSFSPGASRPVLRGFSGERVRVLVDGIGSIDASSTSADHAVTIDPITSERIEVLHGPAVLLFGSQAIGGAVNVFDRRIPRRVPDDSRGVHVDAIAAYGSAAEERSVGAGVDVPVGTGGLVFHVDGSWRETDDLRTGGFILSPNARAEQLEIAAEEEEEGHEEEAAEARALAGLRERLPNSFTRQKTAGVGIALIRDTGNLGFSVSYFGSRYGVPSRPGAEHAHGEEEEGHEEEDHEEEEGEEEHGDVPVSIDLEQIRADLRGEVEVGDGFLKSLRTRLGFADYEHTEFEGDEVGTIFRTQGMEGRVELVQNDRSGWRGVTGAQFFVRDLNAIGAEAFVPANSTTQFGIFTLQELELGRFQLEAAARYEHSDVRSKPINVERRFDSFSAALGGSYEISNAIRAGVNVSRAVRAPAAEELFSNGPHIATQAFERGDVNLRTEKSWGGELYVRAQTRNHSLNASLFYTRFDDYIYDQETGEEEDGLPVFQYLQRDATYWGFEIGGSTTLADTGRVKFVLDGGADYVRATIKGGGPVPRIPPLRLLGGIEAQTSSFDGRLEVEQVFEQDRVAALETPTEGFTFVNASLTWRPLGRRNPTSLILSANNIFDVEARRHASFTKEFVPLAGRDLRISARISF